ncbi:MAG: lysine exporter LysO family protein [Synergistales bacterium]|nr:lysine exporter LysO family protein [Synergistales bacterium]
MSFMPVILLCIGIFLGVSGIIPPKFLQGTDNLIKGLVILLCFVIGMDMGKDQMLWKNIRSMGRRAFLIPVISLTGSILGGITVGIIAGIPLAIASAASVGSGYYSLTTVLLKQLAGPEAATIGFISNLLRELLVMTTMPIFVKYFGRNGAVCIAGATAMDTSLPFIVRSAGKQMALAAFVSGVLITVAMPILIPLCYRLF